MNLDAGDLHRLAVEEERADRGGADVQRAHVPVSQEGSV